VTDHAVPHHDECPHAAPSPRSAGSAAANQSQIPDTADWQLPHPVPALVTLLSAAASVAPARHAVTSAPLLTVLHRQISALDGSSAGELAGLAGPARFFTPALALGPSLVTGPVLIGRLLPPVGTARPPASLR